VRYAIVVSDDGGPIYWTTRYGNTDNYSTEKSDATLFADKSAAFALIKTLKLDSDHEIKEV